MIIGIIESFIRSIVLCIVKPSIRYCLRKVDGDDNMIVTSQPQAGDEVVPRRQIELKTVFTFLSMSEELHLSRAGVRVKVAQ